MTRTLLMLLAPAVPAAWAFCLPRDAESCWIFPAFHLLRFRSLFPDRFQIKCSPYSKSRPGVTNNEK